jgi:hypothetical protein
LLAPPWRTIGQESGRYFQHPDTKYFLEFPSGPLAVGGEAPLKLTVLGFETGELLALSPTDRIKRPTFTGTIMSAWNRPCLWRPVMKSTCRRLSDGLGKKGMKGSFTFSGNAWRRESESRSFPKRSVLRDRTRRIA